MIGITLSHTLYILHYCHRQTHHILLRESLCAISFWELSYLFNFQAVHTSHLTSHILVDYSMTYCSTPDPPTSCLNET